MRAQFKILRSERAATRGEVRRFFDEVKEADLVGLGASSIALGDGDGGRLSGWSRVGSLAFSDQVVPSDEAARDYLLEETAEGGPAIAIRVREILPEQSRQIEAKVWATPEAQALMEEASEASERLCVAVKTFHEKEAALSRLFLAKAGFADCIGCKSRLAKAYLERAQCPLCSESLLPEGQRAELHKLRQRAAELEERYRRARAVMGRAAAAIREKLLGEAKDEELYWVVGAKIKERPHEDGEHDDPRGQEAGGEKERPKKR